MANKKNAAAAPDEIKVKLIHFFTTLKQQGRITGVVSDLGRQLAKVIEQQGYETKSGLPLKQTSFKHFDVKDARNCTSSLRLCNAVITAIPLLRLDDVTIETMQPLYEKLFDRTFDISGAQSGRLLFRKQDIRFESARYPLVGDYILFRTERRTNENPPRLCISKSFLRFFDHGSGSMRFMFLPGARADRLLGAKGWVDDLNDRYLCSGQIIDREADELTGEKVYGGSSTLIVEAKAGSPFLILSDQAGTPPQILAAPVLHLRALHNQEPSFSRGYLVRCYGFEKMGGTQEGTPATRYPAIRQFQTFFGTLHGEELTLTEAARVLARATGFANDVFYTEKGTGGWPSGLLANLPFNDGTKGVDEERSWPIQLPDSRSPAWKPGNRHRIDPATVGIFS